MFVLSRQFGEARKIGLESTSRALRINASELSELSGEAPRPLTFLYNIRSARNLPRASCIVLVLEPQRRADYNTTSATEHKMANLQFLIENSRAGACWGIQDCHSCTHSSHACGWCPYSSTCVPTINLLKPVSDANICPLRSERFELRTKALGCGCSTTTLLSVIVTIFATIAGLALLYGIGLAIVGLNQTFGTGAWGGWEVEVEDDGTRKERQWRRSNVVTSFVRRTALETTKESEQEQVTERSRLLG